MSRQEQRDPLERAQVEECRCSSSSTTIAGSSQTLTERPSTTLSQPAAPASTLIKIIDIQKTTSNHTKSSHQEQRRGSRSSYQSAAKQQVAQAPGKYASHTQRTNGSRAAHPAHQFPEQEQQQQQQQQQTQQQSGETLSSFESDYDLLLYIGETETEDIVDTERSLDYQDQTWRASVCGGASLAPTIDGSFSELMGSHAGGHTPEFDLLEFDSKRNYPPVSQQTLRPVSSSHQSGTTSLADASDDCNQEVARVFSSLLTQVPNTKHTPTTGTLDRHRYHEPRLGEMDQYQQQQRSRTLDRGNQEQVSTKDLDKLLAEMSNSIDLNALARFDSPGRSQPLDPLTDVKPYPSREMKKQSTKATSRVEASSESILEELDGASKMLEQMIAEQFPDRRRPNQYSKVNQESISSSCESPRSIVSRHHQTPHQFSTETLPDRTRAMVEPKPAVNEEIHLIPVKIEQTEEIADSRSPKSSLRPSRAREDLPPPPLPERDYDTSNEHSGYELSSNIVPLEPDRYHPDEAREKSQMNKMKQRTLSGVRRMRDKIGDLMGQSSSDPADRRQSRSLTRRSNQGIDDQEPTLGTQIRERLSRSKSRVSRWWQKGTHWSKRAQSTPNTKTPIEDDAELFQPSDIARMSGNESPIRLEPVKASLGSVSSSSSETTHLSGLESTGKRPSRPSRRRSNKSADSSDKQRERTTSLLSLKRLSSSLRSHTPTAKEDLDSIHVNVKGSQSRAAEMRRRKRKEAGKPTSECSSGAQSDTSGLIQVAERPPDTQEYFSQIITSRDGSTNPLARSATKSLSLRSVRRSRAPSLTSLGNNTRINKRLPLTTNTFRPISAQADAERIPVSVLSQEPTRAQTITPVGPTGRSESADPRHDLLEVESQPVARTKSASILSEFKQKCSNLLRLRRTEDTVKQPMRPPRRSKSMGPVQEQEQVNNHQLSCSQQQNSDPKQLCYWKPVIESHPLSTPARRSRQLDSSELPNNQREAPQLESLVLVGGGAPGVARRLSLDTESTWESSDQEAELEMADSSKAPCKPDVCKLELERVAEPGQLDRAELARTTATSGSNSLITLTTDRLVARASAQTLPGEPVEWNDVKQVQQVADNRKQQVVSAAVFAVAPKVRPPPPPPTPTPTPPIQPQLSKPTPPPRLLAAPNRHEKTCRKPQENNMEQRPPVGSGQRLQNAEAASSADLWRFKFSEDLPEPRGASTSTCNPHPSNQLNERDTDDDDEKRFSTYENVIQDSTESKQQPAREVGKLPSWPPTPEPNNVTDEPPKPPRVSLANKPPNPERKLIKMLSIIQDPNDELMIAQGSTGSSGFTSSASGSAPRCDSIRSLASVFDGTMSNGALNNYNSDSESSLVAPRQKLLAKFEQQSPQKQQPKQSPSSIRTGTFGGQKAGSRVKRLAKTFDQGTAPICEQLKPEEESQSEALSVVSWHDAEQLNEAEVAKFLEELDNSHASVSTGAEPFVTVADSIGLEGAEETRAETIVSDQEDDNTLNEEQLADEENLGSPEWQVAGTSSSTDRAAGGNGVAPLSLGTTLESELNEGPDKDQNDNVILIEPPSIGSSEQVIFKQSPKETICIRTNNKQANQDQFKSSLNRLIGRRISVPLASGEHPRKHQQQQVSMTTGTSLDVPVEGLETGKSKSPSSELRGLSRYYRALLSRRKRHHTKSRERTVLDDSIQSSSSSSCSEVGSSSENEDEDNPKTARFCEKLERMLAARVADQQQQANDDTNNSLAYSCKDSLSGDEPGSLSSSSAVSYESLPEVRHRQVLQKLYNSVKEIHSSEAKFVETLKLLNEDLRKHIEGVPSQQTECLSRLLKHLPQLQALNESLLAELATACEQWPHTRKIAHVLVKMGPFLKHYSAYIREFDSVQQQLADCQRRWPLLADRLRSFEATDKCQKLSVLHHLLRPVQRIPQYRLMLQQYLSQLKPDDPDYEDTVSALEVVSRVAEHANQSMSEGINSAKLLALQAKVVGKQRDIVQPGRLFIREGELLKVSRKQPQPRWFVLLSDALLYLTQIQSSDLLYLNNEFPIDDCQVSTPSEQLIGDQFHSEFNVRTSQRSFALIARSRQERDDWVASIRDTADKYIARCRSLRASQASQVISQESPNQHPPSDGSTLGLTTNVSNQGTTHGELLGQRAPLWTPDSRVSMCQLCTSNFSALFRRHHCRACGRVVCSVCSSNRAPLMYLKCRQARVCDHCFHLLRANLHLYYLGADQQRLDSSTDTTNLRKLDEHFRTLLRSQFVRGSLLRGRTASKVNGHQSQQAELGKLKQLGHNDSGSAISGYLHRRHPSKSKWKRRWFVIQERVLYEYRAIDDVAPMSSLPLLGYQADQPEVNIDGLEARSLIRLSHKPSHSTGSITDTNKTSSRTIQHLFKAESVGAAERWLDAFTRYLQLHPQNSGV